MELSSTSKTQWCKPRSSVGPIYIPGRWRTPARPSSLSIFEASYFSNGASFSDGSFSGIKSSQKLRDAILLHKSFRPLKFSYFPQHLASSKIDLHNLLI